MRAFDALPRIVELSLEAARQAGSLAVSVAKTVGGPVLGRPEDQSNARTRSWDPPTARPEDQPPPPPRAQQPAAAASPPPPAAAASSRPAAAPPEPDHVDREAVVVAESADAGAAGGAGAQIRIAEPWDGYSRLTAKDVTAQLATADPAMLAVVRLYEAAHRNRSTVLAEIDRRLATAGR